MPPLRSVPLSKRGCRAGGIFSDYIFRPGKGFVKKIVVETTIGYVSLRKIGNYREKRDKWVGLYEKRPNNAAMGRWTVRNVFDLYITGQL
jgi:hypothetical protein